MINRCSDWHRSTMIFLCSQGITLFGSQIVQMAIDVHCNGSFSTFFGISVMDDDIWCCYDNDPGNNNDTSPKNSKTGNARTDIWPDEFSICQLLSCWNGRLRRDG